MRGLLALGIGLLHFGFNRFAAGAGWAGIRLELGVDVFFLLSGYVLAHSTRAGISPGRFAVRRFLRLAPVFYGTTLVAILATGRLHPLEPLLAVPLVGALPINAPAWSITWELYLPVLATLIPWRLPDRLIVPLLIACLVGLGLADVGVVSGREPHFLRALFGLAGGYLLYRSGLSLRTPMIPLCLGLAAIMALSAYLPAIAVVLPPLACAAILAGRHSRTVLSSRPAQFFGAISYSFYMAHMPVLMLLGQLIDYHRPSFMLIGMAASIAVAWLLTRYVERPFMALRSAPAQTAP